MILWSLWIPYQWASLGADWLLIAVPPGLDRHADNSWQFFIYTSDLTFLDNERSLTSFATLPSYLTYTNRNKKKTKRLWDSMSQYDIGVPTTLLRLFIFLLFLILRFALYLSPSSLTLARSLNRWGKARGKWYEIVCRSSETWKGILKARQRMCVRLRHPSSLSLCLWTHEHPFYIFPVPLAFPQF